MTHVILKDVNVKIPIYDSQTLRLLQLPSFRSAKVGTRTISHVSNVVIMHVLRGIELDLSDGARVCLIGQNGAGKTTMLRVIAGIYPATSGSVDVDGTVFPLLGTSLAMNVDATGYENISMIARLYDWPKESMAKYVRDIEEFTELGEYLSLPTRVYSTGMQARLAFAIATTRSPDILLIDEGIGAGDAQFQQKVRERIERFVSGARIILLASHSTELCRALCDKALLLSKGESIFFGDIDEAFDRYARMGLQ